jgi:hypothetical protein
MKTLKHIFLIGLSTWLITGNIQAQDLTIYILPSAVDRTWESPREILATTILNVLYPEKYKKRILGHAIIKLSYGEEVYITGSVPADRPEMNNMLLRDGYGLGILHARMKGRLESKEALMFEIASRFKYGNITFLRFKVSPEMFSRLKYYLEEYDSRGYDSIYNGVNKPREGKGAGCTAFAVSFLEVAGFLKEEWASSWTSKVRVPLELIGHLTNDQKVSPLKVLMKSKWAPIEENHIETCFYDPNYMHHWIQSQFYNGGSIEATPVQNNKALGLEFDYRHRVCPSETVFINPLQEFIVSREPIPYYLNQFYNHRFIN